MLPAIVVILFFIGAVMAALSLFVAHAIDEHSKHDLRGYVASLWGLIGVGGAICGWQTLEVLARGASF